MAHQQVHRSRWIACRRRSAAPSITISRLSRGKTVEKCTGSRPARNKKSPSRDRSRSESGVVTCSTYARPSSGKSASRGAANSRSLCTARSVIRAHNLQRGSPDTDPFRRLPWPPCTPPMRVRTWCSWRIPVWYLSVDRRLPLRRSRNQLGQPSHRYSFRSSRVGLHLHPA